MEATTVSKERPIEIRIGPGQNNPGRSRCLARDPLFRLLLSLSRALAPAAAAEAEAAEPGKPRSPGSPCHPDRSASPGVAAEAAAEAEAAEAAEPLRHHQS